VTGSSRGTAPPPALRRLGKRLLRHELSLTSRAGDGRPEAPAVAAAAERAAERLGRPLSNLVGIAGCQALLARALHLAAREWPLLAGVRAAVAPAGSLEGLEEVLPAAGRARAFAALAAVLAHLLWLLVVFIGEALTLHTVCAAWPDLRLGPDDLAPAGRPRESRRGAGAGHPGTETTT
jgi:hypothetical protein